MLVNGNGEMSATLGLVMNGSSFGLGTRFQKFPTIIDDGVVTMLKIEEPGAFEVSSAEYMLPPL